MNDNGSGFRFALQQTTVAPNQGPGSGALAPLLLGASPASPVTKGPPPRPPPGAPTGSDPSALLPQQVKVGAAFFDVNKVGNVQVSDAAALWRKFGQFSKDGKTLKLNLAMLLTKPDE